MRDVKHAMFAVHICDSCKDAKILGDTCVKCRLDQVVDAKIKLNLELVEQITILRKALEFYADRNSWSIEMARPITSESDVIHPNDCDEKSGGVQARDALREVFGPEPRPEKHRDKEGE